LFAAWRLDPFRTAALAGTLQCYESSSNGVQLLPVWQILTTPAENLRNRAERIAPQIAQAPTIASATAVETRSPLAAASPFDGGWPSYAVALTPADGNVQALSDRLTSTLPSVLGRVEEGRLVLDLRTVFPRQDRELVDAFTGGTPGDREAPSENGGEPATPAQV